MARLPVGKGEPRGVLDDSMSAQSPMGYARCLASRKADPLRMLDHSQSSKTKCGRLLLLILEVRTPETTFVPAGKICGGIILCWKNSTRHG
jgi:hypothetical protein